MLSSNDLVPGGGRDLEQLKQEVQRRADHNLPPLGGVAPADARAALSSIRSFDREEWAQAWCRMADAHWQRTASSTHRESARSESWQAWRLFHFARWPTENAPAKQHARQRALEAFRLYASLLDPPIEIVRIPFEGKEIVGYLRLPAATRPAPLVFAIAGLDSRKEDIAGHSETYLKHGMGLLAIDLPGTGESPYLIADVDRDRIFAAVLDYLGTRPEVNAGSVIVQGRSWSGYWAARLAITQRDRLRGAVVHGGPIHRYFGRDWLEASLATGEYLYDYLHAKCAMFGAQGLEDMLARARPYSLLEQGLLDRPSAPMLVVNGARDSQIPIADAYLLLEHGDAKEAWINPQGGHMGRSPQWPSSSIAEKVLMPWMLQRLK
ncbi:MAG: alpha/beta hydrolase family protein [Burkholderiales bacterium]